MRREAERAYGAESAWELMLALAEHRRLGRTLLPDRVYAHGEIGERLSERPREIGARGVGSPGVAITPCATEPIRPEPGWSEPAQALFALYAPMAVAAPGRPFAIGHLGQSLDGCIATASGHSRYVTGDENLRHLHRLRALADAVIVGAGTAAADDPRLTTRLVPGPDPVRVVIDPSGRLSPGLGVFRDGAAPTLHAVAGRARSAVPETDTLRLPPDRASQPGAIVAGLAARGLATLFVEGGGVTVSAWVLAGLLDRLHLAVAPVLIGEGRRALQTPSVDTMIEACRPATRRWRMGEDVLWDLDLRRAVPPTTNEDVEAPDDDDRHGVTGPVPID